MLPGPEPAPWTASTETTVAVIPSPTAASWSRATAGRLGGSSPASPVGTAAADDAVPGGVEDAAGVPAAVDAPARVVEAGAASARSPLHDPVRRSPAAAR